MSEQGSDGLGAMKSHRHAYEAITTAALLNRAEAVARAEAVLRDGWMCGGYRALRLPAEIPWALLSEENRS